MNKHGFTPYKPEPEQEELLNTNREIIAALGTEFSVGIHIAPAIHFKPWVKEILNVINSASPNGSINVQNIYFPQDKTKNGLWFAVHDATVKRTYHLYNSPKGDVMFRDKPHSNPRIRRLLSAVREMAMGQKRRAIKKPALHHPKLTCER